MTVLFSSQKPGIFAVVIAALLPLSNCPDSCSIWELPGCKMETGSFSSPVSNVFLIMCLVVMVLNLLRKTPTMVNG
jgi:hypothetical protein